MTEQQSHLSPVETSESNGTDSHRADIRVETGSASAVALGQAAAPEPLVVTQPATGQTQEISLEAGQPVLLTMAADETFIAVENNNFVLSFDGDGDGTVDSRVVFLNLVDQAASENPPQFVIGGQVVSSGLLITQTIALGGGNGEPIPFETAAGEVAIGGGNNVYDDDLGSAIALLAGQDVIPPTSLVFSLPDPIPGDALDLTSDTLDPGVPPPPPPPGELFAPVDFDVSVTALRNFGLTPVNAPNVTEGVLNIGLEEEVPGFFYDFQIGFAVTPDDNIRGTDVEDGTTEDFTITSLPQQGFLIVDLGSDGNIDYILQPEDIGTDLAQLTTADSVRYFLPLRDITGENEGLVLPELVSFNYFTTDSDGLVSDGAIVTINFENGLPGELTVQPDVEDIRPNRTDDPNAPEVSVTIDVLANDSHSDGLPLTLADVDIDPALGSAVIVDNQIVFTPVAGLTETVVQMTYTVTTPDGLSAQTTVDVTIGQDVSVQSIVEIVDRGDVLQSEIQPDLVIDVDGPDGTSTDPTSVDVTLYPNSDVTFTVTADPEAPDVLDLYLLQDLTGSFRDDLPTVRGDQNAENDPDDLGLLDDLVAGVEAISSDAQFGLGSFRDFGEDAGSATEGQYGFRHHLDLEAGQGGQRLDGEPAAVPPTNPNLPAGEDVAYDELFAGDPDAEVTGLGGDFPERQLFALNEVAKDAAKAEDGDGGTTSDFGFREGSSKVVVIITDATSKDWDNASFRQELKSNLQAAGIIPIFLVANGDEIDENGPDFINDFYDDVIAELGVGARVPLELDSSNLVEAIEQGLGQINQNLTLEVEGDENEYVSIGDPVVDPETGEHTWEVTLSAPLDKGHNNDDDITLKVTSDSTGEQVGGDINLDVTTDAPANGGDDFDIVEGHNGQNVLTGGAGDDLIIGLGGDDILIGGEGNDVFAFGAREVGGELDFDGNDIIQDFTIGEDQINLEAMLDAMGGDASDVQVSNNGVDTVITVDGAADFSITLTGITDVLTVSSDPNSDIVV